MTLNQFVGEPTKRNVGDLDFAKKFQRPNEGETAQLQCESVRSLPSQNYAQNSIENVITTTGNALVINFLILEKDLLYCTAQHTA